MIYCEYRTLLVVAIVAFILSCAYCWKQTWCVVVIFWYKRTQRIKWPYFVLWNVHAFLASDC